jgi:hypothetical protein
LGRAGASAGVPTSGKSAIDIEQPPTAIVDSSNAATATTLFIRYADILRPEIPTSPIRAFAPPGDYFYFFRSSTQPEVA